MYIPEATRIAPLVAIRRKRILPQRGKVLARLGDWLEPADVVACFEEPGELWLVDAGRDLNIPEERATRSIAVAVNDTVRANQVVAGPRGALGRLRRRARSPVDGQVRAVRRGRILIETAHRTTNLHAHVRGQVTSIVPERGVVISMAGSLVQGAWGCGGEATGNLLIAVDQADKPLHARHLSAHCQGTIIVAGGIAGPEVLERAEKIGVAAIVAASASAGLCPSFLGAPYPIVLTEGFGQLPMSEPAFDLLRSNTGREALLSAPAADCWADEGPEIVIPLEGEEKPSEEHDPISLRVGTQIRCLRAPYLGSLGIVTRLPVRPHIVESGARLPVAEVELAEEGEPVLVPLANLELIY